MSENSMTVVPYKKRRQRVHGSDAVFYAVVTTLVILWLVIVLYPIVFIVSSSISSSESVINGKVILWPVNISFSGYQYIFNYKRIWVAYGNTILYTVLGSIVHVIMIILSAYPLARKNFQGRKVILTMFTITMFFGGGLIPTYVMISNLGLTNTRTIMILLGASSMSHIIIMRTFFKSNVPDELLESAKMDGISDFGYLMKIVIPLSKAVISVILLYAVVSHWNSYVTPMIYLSDQSKQPLQIVLQEILLASNMSTSEIQDPELIAHMMDYAESIKYALIVVATVPMIVLYPFIQKFFEKGVMMGSIKG